MFLFAILAGFIGAIIIYIIGAISHTRTGEKWGFKSIGEGIGGFFKAWAVFAIIVFVLGILIICVGESYG